MQPASGRRWATFSGLNVGAGAGAYEPRDLEVTAVEPSRVMREQRPPEAVHPLTPEQLGRADPYDCLDGSFHAYWRRPEAYLEPQVRAGSSVFSRLTPREVDDGVARLSGPQLATAHRATQPSS